MNNQIEQKLDSREVAEMMEVSHPDLLRKIDGINEDFRKSKIAFSKYWEESSYRVVGQARNYRRFLITKRGCEFLAHKTTGTKGNLFTDRYMDRFEQMKEYIEDEVKTINNEKPSRLEEMETETKLNNSQTRKANSLMRMHKQCSDPIVKELLFKKAVEILTGKKLIDNTRKTYSAEEIGKKLGITANKVGRIANANNLKTERYGELVATEYNDKAQGSTFRYYDTVIPVIEKILKEQ